jgi:hypothetical protein
MVIRIFIIPINWQKTKINVIFADKKQHVLDAYI